MKGPGLPSHETHTGGPDQGFQQTAWTQILQAQDGTTATVRQCLDHLIELYWKPVYFHIRRKGHSIEDAKDLTQQFFLRFMERRSLHAADPDKGKFRTYLLASLNHFLCDEYDRRNAQKRQPDHDYKGAEKQFHEDHTFERDWALSVLEQAFGRLRDMAPREARIVEAQRGGKTRYADLAAELDLSETNVKALAHRGRQKLRAIILDELKKTVSEPGAEKEELAHLFQAFSL